MKDKKLSDALKQLETNTETIKLSTSEYSLLKCLNNINNNLDDIRVILRDLKNCFVYKNQEK